MDLDDYMNIILSHYHRKVQREESRTVGDAHVVGDTFEFIGRLPLHIPIVSRPFAQ